MKTIISLFVIFFHCFSTSLPLEATDKFKIAVIPMGTHHQFWKSIHEGALKAAEELGNVEVIWKGPHYENNSTSQVLVVESFIGKVDAIVISPSDKNALRPPLELATQKGIKVIVVNSSLEGSCPLSQITTNNYEAGQKAGKYMVKLLKRQGRIILLRNGTPEQTDTADREQGFIDIVLKEENLSIVDLHAYAGVTYGEGFHKSQELLDKYPEANAIYAVNEGTAVGMLKALESRGLAGKIPFIGWDASEDLIKGVKEGKIHGLIVQNPSKMGYDGVMRAFDAIMNKKIPLQESTETALITPENINSKESIDLIK